MIPLQAKRHAHTCMHTRDVGQRCVLGHSLVTLKFQNGINQRNGPKKPTKTCNVSQEGKKNSLYLSLEHIENHETAASI